MSNSKGYSLLILKNFNDSVQSNLQFPGTKMYRIILNDTVRKYYSKLKLLLKRQNIPFLKQDGYMTIRCSTLQGTPKYCRYPVAHRPGIGNYEYHSSKKSMELRKAGTWFISKLTIIRWLRDYSHKDFRGDLTGGITVGIILVPQAMAYAVLAGLPPVYGLYASVIPLMIYPLFGTSRHLAVGIVTIDMLVVAAGIGTIADPGTEQYIYLVILTGLMAGLIQISMSIARLGFIVNLISKPVILGFTAAASIIIAFSQLGSLLGIETVQSQHIYTIIGQMIDRISAFDPVTASIGVGSVVIMLVLKQVHFRVPEAIVIVVGSGLVIWILGLKSADIELVGAIPRGLPSPDIPGASFEEIRRLLPAAITISLIQFMNITSLGRSFASRHQYTISPNRELFAIGSANLVGSFFHSVPVSGSFSRTAVNEHAGGSSPLGNVFAAMMVLATLVVLTPLLYFIPMAALAAIIIVASLSLIDIEQVRYLFRAKERDGYIAIFTFVTTLVVGIQEGILLGVGASLTAVLVRTGRPNVAILGHIRGSRFYRDLSRFPEAEEIEDILIMRVDASFSFTNAEFFKEYIIERIENEGRTVKAVIIDGMSINDLDTTAIEALEIVIENLNKLGLELHFAGLKGEVRDIMLRSGLARKLGGNHFHMTVHHAVEYILKRWQREQPGDGRFGAYRENID